MTFKELNERNKKSKQSYDVPNWIFFALYFSNGMATSWTEEKAKLAEGLVKNLKEQAVIYDWPKEIVDRVFATNDMDNSKVY